MLASIWKPARRLWQKTNSRALDKALDAAKKIREIENTHFQGEAIAFCPEKGKTVSEYFQTQLKQHLWQIRYNLASFHWSSWLMEKRDRLGNQETEVLDKLSFIEAVLKKYRDRPNPGNVVNSNVVDRAVMVEPKMDDNTASKNLVVGIPRPPRLAGNGEHRSLMEAMSQIRRELTPEYEAEVIEDLRTQRREKKVAIRWLLLLVIIPLVIQITSRNLIFEPLLNRYRDENPSHVKVSAEISERYLEEFGRVKEALEVGELVGIISGERREEELRKIATKAYREVGYRSLDAYKNLAADALSLLSFIFLVYIGRNQLVYIRNFCDRTFRSLNDLAKVYILILVTDLFVGFHSAEGWEVILESFVRHLGLPENKALIYGFIATVPVILDATLKLWIFNYLTRSSPTSVAIYEKMNQ